MLKLYLTNVLAQKGINKPQLYLVKNGFTRTKAQLLLDPTVNSIDYSNLERLCILLKCTPNDILVWHPNDQQQKGTSHPLQQLKPKPNIGHLNPKLEKLPLHQLEALHQFIDALPQ